MIKGIIIHKINSAKKVLSTKGSFAQNFAFNFSGKVIGIVLQVVFAPLLARVYDPKAYGIFAVFNAIVLNLSLISTVRLENALVLPDKETEFKDLLKTGVSFAFFFSLLISLVSIIGHGLIVHWAKADGYGMIFYALGPIVFLNAISQLTGGWVVRQKAFKDSFHYGIPISLGTRIFSLGYGYFSNGSYYGLILSDILNKLTTVFIRFRYILKSGIGFLLMPLSRNEYKRLLHKYRQFPFFDLPGSWINMLSGQLPVFLVASFFGANAVGQLGFAISLLEVPMGLLGNAISPVFLQKAAETNRQNPADLGRITGALYQKLLHAGVFPFIAITVFGDWLFKFAFGNRWEMAGVFTSYLGIFYMFRLISSPISSIFVVLQKQNKLFFFQAFLIAGRFGSLLLGAFFFKNVFTTILLFGIFNAVAYLVLSFMVLHLVMENYIRLIIRSIVLIISCFAIFYIIRVLIIHV
jgi:O-antigen/teichoic acid export membrane protein